MAEKITRDEYEAFVRHATSAYEQLVALGWSIKPCDCEYDGCQGWVFTCDLPPQQLVELVTRLYMRVRSAPTRDDERDQREHEDDDRDRR